MGDNAFSCGGAFVTVAVVVVCFSNPSRGCFCCGRAVRVHNIIINIVVVTAVTRRFAVRLTLSLREWINKNKSTDPRTNQKTVGRPEIGKEKNKTVFGGVGSYDCRADPEYLITI